MVGVHGASFLSAQFPATVVQSSVEGFVIALSLIPMEFHVMLRMLFSTYLVMKINVHVWFIHTIQIKFQIEWRSFLKLRNEISWKSNLRLFFSQCINFIVEIFSKIHFISVTITSPCKRHLSIKVSLFDNAKFYNFTLLWYVKLMWWNILT